MKHIVNQIHTLLIKNKQRIAVAESCTGGLLCELLTRRSGSSRFFLLGIVAYSNLAKQKVLKVPSSIISGYGAVSKEAASAMAAKIRKIAGADIGIGITGIAGPTGKTSNKPVGTVFIALASQKKQICSKFIFKGNRSQIRNLAARKTLILLKEVIRK